MKLRIIRVDLPLKHVLKTSQSSVSVARTVVVELEQDALRGHGEVQEKQHYGIAVEEITDKILSVNSLIEDYALADPIAFWRYLQPALGDDKYAKYAQCAIDMAACDLWGKIRNRLLWRIWGLKPPREFPPASRTIGLDSVDEVLERFENYADWPVYKIKVGLRNDMEVIRALRARTKAAFRLDANGAWNVDTTLRNVEELKSMNVEFIEQPLPADDWDGMKILKKKCPIPIMADESCYCEEDIDRCAEYFMGVNIKLSKFGGITPTRNAIAHAKEKGLKILLGCGIESTISISASAQFAALADYIDLDGPLLIEKKVGTGVRTDKGKLIYPDENGTGIRVVFR
ncbi:MAG: dipeptide epimerase [Planctomycetaceae bacterium]|jgi:L-alanine-DL-glutamate epimerase-like enolase superfamily enzyme|nr:dipeptide epimerase [Planctomycetaceae bacterium]